MSQTKSQGTSSTIEEVNANLIDLEEDCKQIITPQKSSQKKDLSDIIDQTTADISEKSEQKIDAIDLDSVDDNEKVNDTCQKQLDDLLKKFNDITCDNNSRLKAKEIYDD